MIFRYWRGWTTPENSDAYEDLVSDLILPRIADRGIGGCRGAYLLRRELAGEVEPATVLLFDSPDAVRVILGEDYEAAYVPTAARALLSPFDDRSAHYEVPLTPTSESPP